MTVLSSKIEGSIQPEVAQLSFDGGFGPSGMATNGQPAWIVGVEQEGGRFSDQPKCWHVDASQPVADGRLSILVDRRTLQEDVALSILYQEEETADVVVQLLDAENRVIVLDLFGNLIAVGREAKTDTFIVPLRRYPTATKITIRRIRGEVSVYGVVLYPVVGEAAADSETLRALAGLLRDPLSPENPLVRGINRIADDKGVSINWVSSGGPVQVPTGADGGRTPTRDGLELGGGWEVLPFPRGSPWPGPRGEPAFIGREEMLLQGQPVRSLATFTLPSTVECEVSAENLIAHGSSLFLFLVPKGQARDADLGGQPGGANLGNATLIGMSLCDGDSECGREGRIQVQKFDETVRGEVLWTQYLPDLKIGWNYRLKLRLYPDHIETHVDDKTYNTTNVSIPYGEFYVQLITWQPTNRWHVRNLSVR